MGDIMTCKINADTSNGLKLESDTSGVVDIQDNGTTRVTIGDNVDIHGNEFILDADGDTTITADTDDQVDIKIAGADDFKFIANQFQTLSGSTQLDHCRPYFHAYLQAHTNVTSGTGVTKVALNVELFDSDDKFDNSTNYRFTPGVAGFYLVSSKVQCNAADAHFVLNEIRKNGGGTGLNYAAANFDTRNDGSAGGAFSADSSQTRIIELDGDDYIELFGAVVSTSTCQFAGHDNYGGYNCFMTACKIG
jgi:hypothetical protein